ncbi:DNA topoisomerase IB [Ectothiorhodospiraceae bacterium 2226]|nr:DNA topoisomerase IB [Ectothiorhodospiraceae bacterium 2226]
MHGGRTTLRISARVSLHRAVPFGARAPRHRPRIAPVPSGTPPPTPSADLNPPLPSGAGLRYVCDREAGIVRVRCGRGYTYRDARGNKVADTETLERIRALAIPPAWTEVWICADPCGHLQATGRDAKGRKQYRYHARWSEVRNATKFERLVAFAEALPAVRARMEADLAGPGLPREKVIAAVVRLLEATAIRVGNAEYARENASFGLTTLRDPHVDVSGATIAFHFRGKSGKVFDLSLQDRRLARIVRRCQELPGQELFQYLDASGEPCVVSSTDVNDYLRATMGDDFSAKDFRTWSGTVAAAEALRRLHADNPKRVKSNLAEAVKAVAEQLANTPAVCRRHYIHPDLLEAYEAGVLFHHLPHPARRRPSSGLTAEEHCVLIFLRKRRA